MQLMEQVDPFFPTQDAGSGSPAHFATTYGQLDMLHHLLRRVPEAVNLRDRCAGMTPLHRAALLCSAPGYTELYEYLLWAGADPSVLSDNYMPYLYPGKHMPRDLAPEVDSCKEKLERLEEMYRHHPKQPLPHWALGDWWALYDYGIEEIRSWPHDRQVEFPEDRKRRVEQEEKELERERRRRRRAEVLSDQSTLSPAMTPDASETKGNLAILFPGQGAQRVGMLDSAKHLPAVQRMLETCKRVLGYDLLHLCIEGPQQSLDETLHSQPALFVAGLSAIEKLRSEEQTVLESATATAGFSLGEITALCFSGAISFEDGLQLVKARAEGMSEAANSGTDQCMLTVVGLDEDRLESICYKASHSVNNGVCKVANYLFPQGGTVSGDSACVELVQEEAAKAGARKVQRVAVSGAFHTERMALAQEYIKPHVDKIGEPKLRVYSNTTGKPIESAEQARELVLRQIVEPVKWQTVIEAIGAEGMQLYEAGPGQQLKAMTKRISSGLWNSMRNLEV